MTGSLSLEPELRDEPRNCVVNRLLKCSGPLVVYGAGYCAESIANAMLAVGRPVDAFCVDDEFHQPGRFVSGKPVRKFTECLSSLRGVTLAVGFGTAHPNWGRLRAHPGVLNVYGNVGLARGLPFTEQYISENWTAFCELYKRLGDDVSRQGLSDYVNSRLFGHTPDLPKYANPAELFCDPILGCSDSEIYCDCGAYDGDTIRRFLSHTTGYKKIYAWEPDKLNAGRLRDFVRQQNLPQVEVIEQCVGREPGFVNFAASGTSVSTVSSSGDTVPVNTIDARCQDATLLKIDIEGAEADALLGATQTLRVNQTKVLVAVYHRRDDLLAVSEILVSLRPASKILLRWHRTAADDVMLYAI